MPELLKGLSVDGPLERSRDARRHDDEVARFRIDVQSPQLQCFLVDVCRDRWKRCDRLALGHRDLGAKVIKFLSAHPTGPFPPRGIGSTPPAMASQPKAARLQMLPRSDVTTPDALAHVDEHHLTSAARIGNSVIGYPARSCGAGVVSANRMRIAARAAWNSASSISPRSNRATILSSSSA